MTASGPTSTSGRSRRHASSIASRRSTASHNSVLERIYPARYFGRGEAMKAIRLHAEGLRLEDLPQPQPGPGDVLVRVHAAGITRDELTWPTDRLPAIPSYELCGVVESTGEEVIALTPFDRDGVAAEWASVPRSVLAPKPSGLTDEEAAALPMPGLTA